MKNVLISAVVIFLAAAGSSYPQTYNGNFQEFFFGRQPSARAEAMGRGLSAVTGDAFSYYYNPAAMASLDGLNLTGSYSYPYYNLDTGKYNYFSASYKIKKYGTVGFSRDYFTYGFDVNTYDELGNKTGTYTPYYADYRLTLASEVIRDLFVGANLHIWNDNVYSSWGGVSGTSNTSKNVFYLDLGVLKSFRSENKKMSQRANLASTLINVNSASIEGVYGATKEKLPVIFRLGGSYALVSYDRKINPKLNSYGLTVNAEYEDLLNSKYFSGFHGGLEFTFLEIISLRAGYFTFDNEVTGYDSVSKSVTYNSFNSNAFTYGAGINIPVRQLTKSKTPLEIKFDFANMKQPDIRKSGEDWRRFSVYSFIVNWIL